MEELAGVVGAVAETRAVETGVTRLVDLLCCVALHKQVDGHDTGTLQGIEGHTKLKLSQQNKIYERIMSSQVFLCKRKCNLLYNIMHSNTITAPQSQAV